MAFKTILTSAIAFAFFTGTLSAAETDWQDDQASRFRVLMAKLEDGRLAGGIEIQTEPGWHTYWRVPGDVGVPPIFSFEGSENIRDVIVKYPVPERYSYDNTLSLVYFDQVVFPLAIIAEDPGAPVRLNVNAFYGVCEKVCIPVKSTAELTYGSSGSDTPVARLAIERAERALPGRPEPGVFEVSNIQAEGDSVSVTVTSPEDRPVDLFVAPPDNWTLSQPELKHRAGPQATFEMKVIYRAKGETLAGQSIHFVAVSGSRAIEQDIVLPE